jgi:MinD superfamily P-loop ATPase
VASSTVGDFLLKELVVVSGKGGTGKTSIVASFAALAEEKVLVDCDVDAANLHLVLSPEIKYREDFSGGKCARIDHEKCIECGECVALCRFDAIVENKDRYSVDSIACEGCNVCATFCPVQAIVMEEAVNGEWYLSDTRCGPMVHARLGIAEENSGKLVSIVRRTAREIAERDNLKLIIVDGPPGIGCPVIASVTGADFILIITEPTLSAIHDLERVAELARHFKVPGAVIVNKHDLNPDLANKVMENALGLGLTALGYIRYDPAITKAQIAGLSVVEYSTNGAAGDIRKLWKCVSDTLSIKRQKPVENTSGDRS